MNHEPQNANFAGWIILIALAFVAAGAADRIGALICWAWSIDCG